MKRLGVFATPLMCHYSIAGVFSGCPDHRATAVHGPGYVPEIEKGKAVYGHNELNGENKKFPPFLSFYFIAFSSNWILRLLTDVILREKPFEGISYYLFFIFELCMKRLLLVLLICHVIDACSLGSL